MAECFLAADSGGSKTLWALIDEKGEELSRVYTHGLASLKEDDGFVAEISKEAFNKLSPLAMPKKIFMSLGGPNTEQIKRILSLIWKTDHVEVQREARGDAILSAAAFLNCRAVVMCGTGSVAVGEVKGKRRFAGGWGPIYGDEGSGGGIGAKALKLYLDSLDGERISKGLEELLGGFFCGLDCREFEDRMEIKKRALNMTRRELASLAPKIYQLAQSKDQSSIALYDEAAKQIARLAANVSEDRSDFLVLLCGGFFTQKTMLLDSCKKYFSEKSRAGLLYEALFSPIVASKLAVLKTANKSVTKALFQKILNDERKYTNE